MADIEKKTKMTWKGKKGKGKKTRGENKYWKGRKRKERVFYLLPSTEAEARSRHGNVVFIRVLRVGGGGRTVRRAWPD